MKLDALETKLSVLRRLMAAEDWPAALRLAARFPQLGIEKAAIVRGHECLVNPRFYRQLGTDPEAAVEAGVEALKRRYAE